MPNQKVTNIYNLLKQNGDTNAKDVSEFAKRMAGDHYRQQVYGFLKREGVGGIGSGYADFTNLTGYGKKAKPKAEATKKASSVGAQNFGGQKSQTSALQQAQAQMPQAPSATPINVDTITRGQVSAPVQPTQTVTPKKEQPKTTAHAPHGAKMDSALSYKSLNKATRDESAWDENGMHKSTPDTDDGSVAAVGALFGMDGGYTVDKYGRPTFKEPTKPKDRAAKAESIKAGSSAGVHLDSKGRLRSNNSVTALQQERIERNTAVRNNTLGKDLDDMVGASEKQAEAQWTQDMSNIDVKDPLSALRNANQNIDPDKRLADLQNSLSANVKTLLAKHAKEYEAAAKADGKSVEEYVSENIIPYMSQELQKRFSQKQLEKYMPKSDAEYVARGILDTIPGMLTNASVTTKSQRNYTQQGEAQFLENKRPKSVAEDSGFWDRHEADALEAGRFGVSLIDPIFGAEMKVGGALAKGAVGLISKGAKAVATKAGVGRFLASDAMKAAASYAARFGSGVDAGVARILGSNEAVAKTILRNAPGEMLGQGLGMNLYGATQGGVNTALNYQPQTADDMTIGEATWDAVRNGLTSREGFINGVAFGGVMPLLHEFGGMFGYAEGAKGWAKARGVIEKGTYEGFSIAATAAVMQLSNETNKWLNGEGFNPTLNGYIHEVAMASAMKFNPATVVAMAKGFQRSFSMAKGGNWKARTGEAAKSFLDSLGERRGIGRGEKWPFRFTIEETNEICEATHTTNLKDALSYIFPDYLAAKGEATPEEVSEAQTKYLEVMNNLSWDAQCKLAAGLTNSYVLQRPRCEYFKYGTDAEGNKLVFEVDKEGNVLSKKTFKTEEEKDAFVTERNLNAENEDLWRSYSEATVKNKALADKAIDTVCSYAGRTREEIEKMLNKEPVRRTEEEWAVVEQIKTELDNIAYPENEVHIEKSRTDGVKAANDADILSDNPRTDIVNDISNEVDNAEAELNMADAIWKQDYDKMTAQGATPADAYLQLHSQYNDQQLEPLIKYMNALSKQEGFMDAIGNKIEEKVSYMTNLLTKSHITIDGEATTEGQIMTVIDNQGVPHRLIAGDVSIDKSKGTIESDMPIIVTDDHGHIDAINDVSGWRFDGNALYEQDYAAYIRQVYGEEATERIDPTGKLSQPQQPTIPQVPQGGGQGGPQGGGNSEGGDNQPPADNTPEGEGGPINEPRTFDPQYIANILNGMSAAPTMAEYKSRRKMLMEQLGMTSEEAETYLDQYIEDNKPTQEGRQPMEFGEVPAGVPEEEKEIFDEKRRQYDKNKTVGSETFMYLPDGERIQGHYVLHEAEEVMPSHDPLNGFEQTAGVPRKEDGRTNNDRNYENDKDAQQTVKGHAATYRLPNELGVVSNEGVVLSGNDRAQARILAAENGTDGKYLADVANKAKEFGFTEEDIAKYKHPTVSFEIDGPVSYDTKTYAKFNANEKKRMNSTESAVKYGKVLEESRSEVNVISQTLGKVETLDELYDDTDKTMTVFNALVKAGVWSELDRANYLDSEGYFTRLGELEFENAMRGLCFTEDAITILDKGNMKAVSRELAKTMPELVKNNSLGEYSIMGLLEASIKSMYEAVSGGHYKEGNIFSYFLQAKGEGELEEATRRALEATDEEGNPIFNNEERAIGVLLANALAKTRNRATPKFLNDLMAEYNKSAEELVKESKGSVGNMFGDDETAATPKREDILHKQYTEAMDELNSRIEEADKAIPELEAAINAEKDSKKKAKLNKELKKIKNGREEAIQIKRAIDAISLKSADESVLQGPGEERGGVKGGTHDVVLDETPDTPPTTPEIPAETPPQTPPTPPEEDEHTKFKREHPLTADEIKQYAPNEDKAEDATDYLNGIHNNVTKNAYSIVYRAKEEATKNNTPEETPEVTNETPITGGGTPQGGGGTPSTETRPTVSAEQAQATAQAKANALTAFKNLAKLRKKADGSSTDKSRFTDKSVITDIGKSKEVDEAFDAATLALADYGLQLIKEGITDKETWKSRVKDEIGKDLKELLETDDAEFDDYLDQTWNDAKAKDDGVRKRLADWAEYYSNIKNDTNNEESTEDTPNVQEQPKPGESGTVPINTDKPVQEQPEVPVTNGGGTGRGTKAGGTTNNGGSNGGKQGGQNDSPKPKTAAGENTGGIQAAGGSGTGNGGNGTHVGNGTGGGAKPGDVSTGEGGVGRNLVDGTPANDKPTVGKSISNLSQEKVPYVAASDPNNEHAIGSVIPSGSADALNAAFSRLVEEHKQEVKDFVRDELGYSTDEEMYDHLASEQVDSVALAINSMKNGKSFIIGDMTGVGKGRQAAALIRWGKLQGKKVMFVTESSDLFTAMYGDMMDVDADYVPFVTNSDPGANITDSDDQVVIQKPSDKAQKALYMSDSDELPFNKKLNRNYDFLMTTYSQVAVKDTASAKAKKDWIKRYAKDAIVILDESHNASGDSKIGEFYKDIVKDAAGVTFLSATYAKRPDNMMLYALKSSMSEANMSSEAMLKAISTYGVPMQELMANALFGSGEMIRRERDMKDVKTTWLEPKTVYTDAEYEKYRKTSDKTMELVNDIISFQRTYVDPIVKELDKQYEEANKAAAMVGAPQTHVRNTPYSGQVSNIVGLMVYGMKAQKAADMAIEQIKAGKKPVIAVENTLGSYIDEMDDVVDSAQFGKVFEKGIKFALKYKTVYGSKEKNPDEYWETIHDATYDLDPGGQMALDGLRRRVEEYFKDNEIEQLSLSPIDLIKKKLADAGYNCGEITGRSNQLVKQEDGTYKKEKRDNTKKAKKKSASKFNGGSVDNPLSKEDSYDALILNVAGATGISLHASKKFGDQKQRSMIILQPARNVNTEVQMRGRIDRTGQLSRGEYYYLTSPIPAEQKMTMMLKQKLASLDANSVGTEEVSSNKVESQDMDNKYGDETAREFLIDHLNDINAYIDGGLTWNKKTRQWEGHEGLLYDVLKGMQRLDCDTQEFILDELTTRYADKIDYLNQNGINDLKTTTMNLDATTIDKATFVKGKDEESPNEFAHNTNLERVEVNVLKKPLRSSDIHKQMQKLGVLDDNGKIKGGGIGDDGEWHSSHGDEIQQKVETEKDRMLAERKAKFDEAEKALEEKIRKEHPQGDMSDEEYEKFIQKWPSLVNLKNKNEEAYKQYDADLTKQYNAVVHATMYLKPGLVYLVPLTDEIKSDSPTMYGRFIGFQPKNGQPRSVQAIFATKDSRAQINVALVNQQAVIDKILESRYDTDLQNLIINQDTYERYGEATPEAQKMLDEWWDSHIPKNTNRQRRYMITGNILQACGSLGKYKGQIVTFTRKNKETGEITAERGMLLAENFDPENFKIRRAVKKEDIWDRYDALKDTLSGIEASRQGNNLVVLFGKRSGVGKLSEHPVLKDTELQDLAMTASDGTKFSMTRDSIAMTFSEKNVEKALELLYRNHSYTKESFFVMPDSSEKVDRIVRTNKPYQEVIEEFKDKYGTSRWDVERRLKNLLNRYKMDIDNEELKTQIREAVQLRQAYLRKEQTKEENSRLAWQVIIEDQRIARAEQDIDRAENDRDLRWAKEAREEHYNVREAILEELEARGIKGTAYHLESGKWSAEKAKEMFDKMNTNKENAELMKMVYEKIKDLDMDIVLNEKIDNDTGGEAAGKVIEYNWKYLNAEYITDQDKANTILHEMIHTVTAYADRCVENGMEHLLKPEMVTAINELHDIFNTIKNDKVFVHETYKDYGITNVREMLSEAGSNEDFRDDLKKANLWVKFMDGILRFFGFESSRANKANAYDSVRDRLEYLITNFNQDAWTQYYKGSRYGEYQKRDARVIESRREVGEHINNLSKELGTKFNIHTSMDGLDAETRHGLERGNKGWYDIKKGEVHLYLPNIHSRYEAEKTILHESVAHKGLRDLLNTKENPNNYNRYMDMIWADKSNKALRDFVKEYAPKNGWDIYEAIDEYIGREAEKTITPEKQSMWSKIQDAFNNALERIGLKQRMNINDVRYAIWLSRHKNDNPNDPLYRARLNALRYKMAHDDIKPLIKNGRYVDAEAQKIEGLSTKSNDVRRWSASLTPGTRAVKDEYETMLKRKEFRYREAFHDNMESLKVLQKLITGKDIYDVKDSENAYIMENHMTSKSEAEWNKFKVQKFQPLEKAINDCVGLYGGKASETSSEIEGYAMKKSGLERNRKLYVRDAINKIVDQDAKDQLVQDYDLARKSITAELKSGAIDFKQYLEKLDDFIRNNIDVKYDPNKNDYSGISAFDEARIKKGRSVEYDESRIIDDVMNTESMLGDKADNLWKAIKDATDYSLDYSYDTGMTNSVTRDKIKDMFDFYVPLRGFADETMEDVNDYVGTKIGITKDDVIKNAKGRLTPAKSPFAHISSMANTAITQGERNLVKQAFYRMISNNKNDAAIVSDIWEEKVIDGKDPKTGKQLFHWEQRMPNIATDTKKGDIADIIEKFENDMKAKKLNGMARILKGRPKFDKVFLHPQNASQHAVPVYINGRMKVAYVLGNPRAAQALNGLLSHENNAFKFEKKLMNITASLATSYSPEFILSNTSRDTFFSNANIASKENAAYLKKFTKNQAICGALMSTTGIGGDKLNGESLFEKYYRGHIDMSKPTEKLFAEFMDNGGRTGFIAQRDIETHLKNLKESIKGKRKGDKIVQALGDVIYAIPKGIEQMNMRAELINRFATYMTSRQMGRSIMRSVADAKEVSVNFNRHGAGNKTEGWAGAIAGQMRDHYMFFNAGMQSMELLYRNMYKEDARGLKGHANPKNMNHALRTFSFMGAIPAAVGFGFATLLSSLDDEKYSNIPSWDRRNNICIPAGDKYVKIPLPIELRAFWGMGDIMASIDNPRLRTEESPEFAMLGQISQALPLDVLEAGERRFHGDSWWIPLLPTTVRPVFENIENVDWTGKPIQKDSKFYEDAPQWTLAYDSTPRILVESMKKIHDWTREGKYTAQETDATGVDISPAKIEHLVKSYFSGAYSIFGKTTRVIEEAYDGKFHLSHIPMASRIFGEFTDREVDQTTNAKFFAYKQEAEDVNKEFSNASNKYNPTALTELNNSARGKRALQFKKYDKILKALHKGIANAKDEDTKMMLKEQEGNIKRSLVDALDQIE